jgi:hypothetical protein
MRLLWDRQTFLPQRARSNAEEFRRPEDRNAGPFHARIRRIQEGSGVIGGKLGIPEIVILSFIMMGFFDFLVGFGVVVWAGAKNMTQ